MTTSNSSNNTNSKVAVPSTKRVKNYDTPAVKHAVFGYGRYVVIVVVGSRLAVLERIWRLGKEWIQSGSFALHSLSPLPRHWYSALSDSPLIFYNTISHILFRLPLKRCSLISTESAAKTAKTLRNTQPFPCTIRGIERAWNKRSVKVSLVESIVGDLTVGSLCFR
jgi:hypothetical protein